jgi:hypothetical protein
MNRTFSKDPLKSLYFAKIKSKLIIITKINIALAAIGLFYSYVDYMQEESID